MIAEDCSQVSHFLPTWFSAYCELSADCICLRHQDFIRGRITRLDEEEECRKCPGKKRNQQDDSNDSMSFPNSHQVDCGVQSSGASGHTSSGETGSAWSVVRFSLSILATIKFSGAMGEPAKRLSIASCPA